MYKFILYNKVLKSPFDLSPLSFAQTTKNSDINVSVIDSVIQKEKKEQIYQIGDDYSFFYKEHVGLYEVFAGKEIIITPETKDNNALAQHLINFPLALCLSQIGSIVLHASAVIFKNKVILFCGRSHSGKSSTSALLAHHGGKLITEDISVIEIEEQMKIFPSAPYLKLSNEISNLLDINKKIFQKPKSDEREFYRVNDIVKKAVQIDHCFFLDWGPNTVIDNISNKQILRNILLYSFISDSHKDMKKVLKFISKVKFSKLNLKKDINKNMEIIEKLNDFL